MKNDWVSLGGGDENDFRLQCGWMISFRGWTGTCYESSDKQCWAVQDLLKQVGFFFFNKIQRWSEIWISGSMSLCVGVSLACGVCSFILPCLFPLTYFLTHKRPDVVVTIQTEQLAKQALCSSSNAFTHPSQNSPGRWRVMYTFRFVFLAHLLIIFWM